MIKILHTSDWHLGQKLQIYERLDDEAEMLAQITDIVRLEQPDALVMSGDIFHTSLPSAAAQKLFNECLLGLRRACPGMGIVMIAGNHDGVLRLEANERLWRALGVEIVSCLRTSEGEPDFGAHIVEVRRNNEARGELLGLIAAVPFTYPQNYPALKDGGEAEGDPLAQRQRLFFEQLSEAVDERNAARVPVIGMAHLYLQGSELSEEEGRWVGNVEGVPLNRLGFDCDYLALGHIHKPQTLEGSKGRARYSGAPLAVNFGENFAHGVTLVELETGAEPRVRHIDLQPSRPLVTCPDQAQSFPDALACMEALEGSGAYVRLHVLKDGQIPTDGMAQATQKAEELGCRFCTFLLENPPTSLSDEAMRGTSEPLTRFDLQQVSPIDIARKYMEQRNLELTTDMENMLRECLRQIEENKQNQ